MFNDDEAGDALDDVAGIRRVVERLRNLVMSATLLDLRASAAGYWSDHRGDDRLSAAG